MNHYMYYNNKEDMLLDILHNESEITAISAMLDGNYFHIYLYINDDRYIYTYDYTDFMDIGLILFEIDDILVNGLNY